MNAPCSECGATLDAGGACGNCGALALVDLDDHQLGLRTEDKFVAMPPEWKLIPRRRATESNAPIIATVAGLLVVALLVAILGPTSRGNPDVPPVAPAPLAQPTGTDLALGTESVSVLEVDSGDLAPLDVRRMPFAPIDRLVRVDDRLFLVALGSAYVLPPGGAAQFLGPATDVFRDGDTAWIVNYPAPETITVRRVDSDGSPLSRPVTIQRRAQVRAALDDGLLLESVTLGGARSLDLWRRDGTLRGIARERIFLAAARDRVVSRERGCRVAPCELVVDDVHSGVTWRLRAGPPSPAVAAISPGGFTLALLGGDDSALVDLHDLSVTSVRGDRDTARATWSVDGRWLFVVQDGGGIDAIDTRGTRYRVPGPPLSPLILAAI